MACEAIDRWFVIPDFDTSTYFGRSHLGLVATGVESKSVSVSANPHHSSNKLLDISRQHGKAHTVNRLIGMTVEEVRAA
jgi:hypothetical protein